MKEKQLYKANMKTKSTSKSKTIADHVYMENRNGHIRYKVVINGKTKTFRSESDAMIYASNCTIQKYKSGNNDDESITYKEVAYHLMNSLKKEQKGSTYQTKKEILERIIFPNFVAVDKRILDITLKDCRQMRDFLLDYQVPKKQKDGTTVYVDAKTNYKNNILVIFKQVFNYAVETFAVANPYIVKIKKIKKSTDEEDSVGEDDFYNIWSPNDFKFFISNVTSNMYKTLFSLSITSWARIGEIQALRWKHYDGSKIHVFRNIMKVRKYIDPKCFIDDTVKSKASKRYIELPKEMCMILDEYKEKQKFIPGFSDDWYIFNRWDGKKYTDGYYPLPRTNIQRAFEKGMELSNFSEENNKKIRIHDLRHSGATLAIVEKQDIKAVSERLGHSSVDITLNIYHHVIEKTKNGLVNNTEQFISDIQKNHKKIGEDNYKNEK